MAGSLGWAVWVQRDLKAVILEFCDRKVENLRACCGIVERTLSFRENSMKRVMKK